MPCAPTWLGFHAARTVEEAVHGAEEGEDGTPPNTGVTVEEHGTYLGRVNVLVDGRGEDEHAVEEQRYANEEPDGNRTASFHRTSPISNLKGDENDAHDRSPEPGAVEHGDVSLRRNVGGAVDESLEFGFGLRRGEQTNDHRD